MFIYITSWHHHSSSTPLFLIIVHFFKTNVLVIHFLQTRVRLSHIYHNLSHSYCHSVLRSSSRSPFSQLCLCKLTIWEFISINEIKLRVLVLGLYRILHVKGRAHTKKHFLLKMLDETGVGKAPLIQYVRRGWHEKALFTENATQGWHKKAPLTQYVRLGRERKNSLCSKC